VPSSPYARLLIAKNGGLAAAGSIQVAPGDSLVLSSEDFATVKAWTFSIYEYPDGFTEPSGWDTDDSDVFFFSGTYTTPAVTIPSTAPMWGKFLCRLEVNGMVPGALGDDHLPFMRDESTGFHLPAPNGVNDFAFLETLQFDAVRQSIGPQKANLRLLARKHPGGSFGAFLANADATIQYGDGSIRVMRPATLGANRYVTLGTTGAELGKIIEIWRLGVENFTLAIINGGAGAGTKHTFAALTPQVASFRHDGTNWQLHELWDIV